MKTNDPDVKRIAKTAFPNYRGRKFSVVACESVIFSDLNWSGGTRSTYAAVRLDNEQAVRVNFSNVAPWNNPVEGCKVEIPEGVVIVEHIHFCGKDLGLRVHVNPANMPRRIEA